MDIFNVCTCKHGDDKDFILIVLSFVLLIIDRQFLCLCLLSIKKFLSSRQNDALAAAVRYMQPQQKFAHMKSER